MKQTISPLRKFLINVDMEQLFAFIQSIGLKYTMTCEGEKHYICRFRQDGMVTYAATGDSPKSAMCACLARFFTQEQNDYHDYQGKRL